MHHRIIAAVETCLHVNYVLSIDEMACKLMGVECTVENATALALKVKAKVKSEAGEFLKCSVGLATNKLLAKVAADMKKPDGLTVITREDLPHKLYPLALDDLPGIGERMLTRLHEAGITSVQRLCELSVAELTGVWRSVLGERWWHALRGDELHEPPTHRRTVGHSHVLPPSERSEAGSKSVLIRLIHKAAARLRHMRYWARRMSVHVEHYDIPGWEDHGSLGVCQDTMTMLELFDQLWVKKPQGKAIKVGVTLYKLVSDTSVTQPLFPEEQNRLKLARAMDALNAKFGSNAVYFGEVHGVKDSAPTRIAFTSIPDLSLNV